MIERIRQDRRVTSLEGMPESYISVTSSSHVQLDERARIETLLTALDFELSELQRHVILLRSLEGLSLKETALIVGKKINSVKVIQHCGIARFRICRRPDDFDDKLNQNEQLTDYYTCYPGDCDHLVSK